MEKVTFDIPRKEDGKWGSYISKYPADSGVVQPNMFTANTRNVITSATGQAEKRLGGAIWNPNSGLSGPALDQYEGVFNTGQRLFIVNDAGTIKASTGNGVFASIQSGFTNPANFEFATYQGRVYGCNGVDPAIVLDIATAYGGVNYVFTTAKKKNMGAQVPASACTAVRNTDSTAAQVPAGSHTYKITFLYYGEEESNGNTASAVCVNDATHTSNALTAIPIGGYGVTARKIYRDNNDGVYLLLATLSNNTATTYTDILPVGSTPTPIPTTHAVPDVFKYIALYLDRLFTIDITGKVIAWSAAGFPDIFPSDNTIAGPQDDVMTAIYVFNGIPYVFGQHTVGTIQGTTDGQFYYSPISQTVGCVDNRSIQTRSIVSVPTLLWLAATPNKGIFYTNGSVVQYLSDYIEDLTFNLAQISYLERSNTQATQAAFQGGTASAGIDLDTNPGAIQTIDPEAVYRTAANWLTGTLSNLVPVGDQLQVPTRFAPAAGSGSFSGDGIFVSGSITLPSTPLTNEDTFSSQNTTDGFIGDYLAQPIDPARNGTRVLNSVTVKFALPPATPQNGFTIAIYSDAGGAPGSALYTSGTNVVNSTSVQTFTVSPGITVFQGNRYWIVLHLVDETKQLLFPKANGILAYAGLGSLGYKNGNHGTWFAGYINATICSSYTVAAFTDSSTWTSGVYDTGSTTLTNNSQQLILTGSYPSGTTGSILVQGSNNQSSWTTTDTLSSPTTTVTLSGGTYRYWRLVITLTTTDNRSVPTITIPILKFDTTGTWTSPSILCTTDITTLDALNLNTVIPASTAISAQVRTSTDNVSWSAYSSVGSATPHKWAQVRVTFTTDTSDMTSPTLVETSLDWSISSNLVSSAIDTGVTPSGWGIFQFNRVGTDGGVTFYFRSASTALGLASASFSAVTNGTFPTSTPLEFCQWKVVMTASAGLVPEVNSVTVNWLLSSGANVRAASMFFNKSYLLGVATQGSTYNNVLIELDYQGNWRIHSGINIGTMATYFNDAFNCDSTNGNVYNMFKLPTDNGTNITFDLRTKAFVFGDDDHLSIVRSCRVKGVNTGTTIHVYYSTDLGSTWNEMLNSSGTLGYTTTNDLSSFNEYFVADFAGAGPLSGRSIIYRVFSNDAFPCQILKVRPTVYVRKGKAITEAMA